MHVQIVNFNLKDLSDEDFRKGSAELAPMFAAVPGLLSKVWLADEGSNVYGGVYLWRDKAAMDAYATTKLTMVPTTVWPMPMSPDSASLSS